jgi:phosphoglycerol transferase
MIAVFVFLILRNIGLHPWVFSDEYNYSQASRLLKASTSNTPLYIYFFVYKLTRFNGPGFLESARVLNAIFFVGAAPFVYLAARRVTGRWIAVLITMLSLLGAINTFTSYFMPEAMFFFVFWWMSWFILCSRPARPIYYGAVTGLLLTILVLVKVNAIFLIPGIMAFMVYASYRDGSSSWTKTLGTSLLSFLSTFVIARGTLGYVFAGRAGLHILGDKYGALAHDSLTPARLLLLTGEMVGVLRGHMLGLALLFAVPLASAITIVLRRPDRGEEDGALSNAAAYLLLLLLPLLIVVAYFTASVLGESPYESLSRLHMRYYDFLFPLFLIVVGGQSATRNFRRNRYAVMGITLALVGLIALSLHSLLRDYTPGLNDTPELQGVTAMPFWFYSVGILGIASAVVWAFNQRRGARLVLFVLMPVMIVSGAVNSSLELRRICVPATVADRAGMFTRGELDRAERSKVVVVDSEPAGVFQALFYIDDAKATFQVIPKGEAYDPKTLPVNHDWVLLIGDHALPAGTWQKIVGDGYVLFHVSAQDAGKPGLLRRTINFSHPFRFGLVDSTSGLAGPESFGQWSDRREIQIKMLSPLPRRFDLTLTAKAFGPNAQLPLSIRIGDQAQTFRLSSWVAVVTLPFTTDGNARTITIEVPQPTSPRQLGLGADDRQLGIALLQMNIDTIADDASAGKEASEMNR